MANDDKPKLTLDELFNFTPEEWKKYIAARNAGKKLRIENPWVLDLIRVLYPHPTGLSRSIVIHTVLKNRSARGHVPPEKSDETIQSALQQYCVHSKVFKNRNAPPEDGIFHWPNGAGAGVWAIYPDKAEAWLNRRDIQI